MYILFNLVPGVIDNQAQISVPLKAIKSMSDHKGVYTMVNLEPGYVYKRVNSFRDELDDYILVDAKLSEVHNQVLLLLNN